MAYTISKASDLTGINPTTIRYYDKEGLLPGIQRMNGIRLFTDEDIKWLHVLSCLKNTGMPISRIREYARLAVLGDESLKERQALIMEQRQFVKEQIDHLLFYMQELDYSTCRSWTIRSGITRKPWLSVQKAGSIRMTMRRKRERKSRPSYKKRP